MNFEPLSEREESITKKLTTEGAEDAKNFKTGFTWCLRVLVAE